LNLCLLQVNCTDKYSNNNNKNITDIYEANIINQIEFEALAVVMWSAWVRY